MAHLDTGRTAQKERTRQLLLTTARRLIESGDTPHVEDVAEASGISRTTAYRYFPNQAALLAAAFPETAATSLLPPAPPSDVDERVALVTSVFVDSVARTESQQRAMLRLSLADEPHELPLRQGRAIGWYLEALDPLRDELGADTLRRLATAMRAVSGIESRVWLTDVAGLSSKQVRRMQLWMADALLAHAKERPPPR